MLEVIHDPYNLPHKILLKVFNPKKIETKLVEQLGGKLERGLRIRIMARQEQGTLELQARDPGCLTYAMKLLKASQTPFERVPFSHLLNQPNAKK